MSAVLKLDDFLSLAVKITTLKQAEAIAGPLGEPSKMPGYAYGISATKCKVGGALQKVEGSVCHKCYALKGHYTHKGVKACHAKRLASLDHPQWVDAMVFMIKFRKARWFRWHDSGDLQSVLHLCRIIEVAKQCRGTKFWLPTRETGMVKQFLNMGGVVPDNLIIRVSAAMIDGEPPEGFKHTSTVVRERPMFGHIASCPAQFNNNQCGKCRQCWDGRVRNVSYPVH